MDGLQGIELQKAIPMREHRLWYSVGEGVALLCAAHKCSVVTCEQTQVSVAITFIGILALVVPKVMRWL